MSTDSTRDDMRKLRANEAADWFLRVKDDDVTERELSEWLEWCADPDNLREFQRTRNTWRSFDQLGLAAAELLETLLAEKEVSARRSAANGTDLPSVWRLHSTLRWLRSLQVQVRAVAALLVVAVAIAGIWYAYDAGMLTGGQPALARQSAIESTVLPDGSTLTLAPRTEIAVDFDDAGRKLALSYGEAYFNVRPDKSKPFVVQTAGLRITAIGTAFDVRSRADRVVVTVQEGIVDVSRVSVASVTDRDNWRVNAGYQIAYDVSTGAARIAAVDPERALAWREGRLEYFSEPLGSVVADVSRYSDRPIEIGDPQLASLTFTGTVFIGSTDDWLGAVESTFPVRVVVTRDDHVLLLRRSPDDVPSDNH